MHKNNSHNVQLNQSGSASSLPEIDKIIEVNNARLARAYEYISQVKTWVESKEEGSFSQFCKVVYLIELTYNNLLHLSKEFTSSELPLLKELVGRFFTEQGSWHRNDRITAAHILNLQEAYKSHSQLLKDTIKKDFFTPVVHKSKENMYSSKAESTIFELLRAYVESIDGNTALKLAKGKVKEELLSAADSLGLGDSFPPAFFVEQDARKYNKPLKTLRAEILETNKFISNLFTIQEDIFSSLEVQSILSLSIQVMGNNFKLLLELADKDKKDPIAKIIEGLPVWRNDLAHSEEQVIVTKGDIEGLLATMSQIEPIFASMALSEVVESGRNKGHNTMFDGLSVVSGITGSTQVTGAKSAQRKKGKTTKKDNDWESILKEAQEDNIKASGLTKKQYEVAEEIVKMTLGAKGASASGSNLKKFISEPNLVKESLKITISDDGIVTISTIKGKIDSTSVRLPALLFAYGNIDIAREILVKYGPEGIKGNEGQILRHAIANRDLEKVRVVLDSYSNKPEELQVLLNSPAACFSEDMSNIAKNFSLLYKFVQGSITGKLSSLKGEKLQVAIYSKDLLKEGILRNLLKDKSESLREVLSKPANNMVELVDGFPLIEAVGNNAEDIAIELLKNGARFNVRAVSIDDSKNIDIGNALGYDILSKSIRSKLFKLVEYLIVEQNISTDIIYRTDNMPFLGNFSYLLQAPEEDLISVIRILHKAGKLDVDKIGHSLSDFIRTCVKVTKLEILKELYKLGVDLNIRDWLGWTFLHAACHGGHIEAAEFLINSGANIEAQIKDYATPLHLACQEGRLKIVELLINNGANKNAMRIGGATPLQDACEQGHLEVAKFLLDSGADKDAQNYKGATALHIACDKGFFEIVKLLLENNANCEVQNNTGATPLHIACAMGYLKIVKLLIESGANIEAQNIDGSTALLIACANGYFDIVKLLVESGANIEAQTTRNSLTPLHAACGSGYFDIVKLLIENEANIKVKDKDGRTPLDYAKKMGLDNIVNLLESIMEDKEGFSLEQELTEEHNAPHIAAEERVLEDSMPELMGNLLTNNE